MRFVGLLGVAIIIYGFYVAKPFSALLRTNA